LVWPYVLRSPHGCNTHTHTGTKSMFKSTKPRHAFLFNDMLLLMSDEKRGALVFHQAVSLQTATLRDMLFASAEDARCDI